MYLSILYTEIVCYHDLSNSLPYVYIPWIKTKFGLWVSDLEIRLSCARPNVLGSSDKCTLFMSPILLHTSYSVPPCFK